MLIYKKDENGFISLKEKLQSVIEELNKELDQVCKQQSTSPVDVSRIPYCFIKSMKLMMIGFGQMITFYYEILH